MSADDPFKDYGDDLVIAVRALREIRDALKTPGWHGSTYGYEASQRAREALWEIEGYPDGRGGFSLSTTLKDTP